MDGWVQLSIRCLLPADHQHRTLTTGHVELFEEQLEHTERSVEQSVEQEYLYDLFGVVNHHGEQAVHD